MFMGPLEAVKPWSMDGVSGVRGFLDRTWRMIVEDRAETMQLVAAVRPAEPTPEQNRMVHKTIQAVARDLKQMSFNTAIARLMEFTNFFLKGNAGPAGRWSSSCCCCRRWRRTLPRSFGKQGADHTLAYQPWPRFDESQLREETIEVPVQINGKLRGRVRGSAASDKAALLRDQPGPTSASRSCSPARRSQGGHDAGPNGQFRGEVNIWHNAGDGHSKRRWRHGASLVCHGYVSRADLVRPLHG